MRFRRRPRLTPFEWTTRKLSAFVRRPEKQRASIRAAYPLLSDQLECEVGAPRSEAEEGHARQEAQNANEQSMRELHAQVWRRGRHAYFNCPDEQRRAIRTEWNRWPGPADAMYFMYVVEKHNGAQQQRDERRRAEAASLARGTSSSPRQSSLPL